MKLLRQNFVFYALLMCLILIICLFLMQLTSLPTSFNNQSPLQMIFQFIAPCIIWFVGIRAKKKQLKKKMTFSQGMAEGLKISFVYSLLSALIFMVYYLFVNPGILESVRNVYGISGTSNATVIALDMVVQFFMSLVFGGILSSIIAFLLKSRKNNI